MKRHSTNGEKAVWVGEPGKSQLAQATAGVFFFKKNWRQPVGGLQKKQAGDGQKYPIPKNVRGLGKDGWKGGGGGQNSRQKKGTHWAENFILTGKAGGGVVPKVWGVPIHRALWA